MISISRSFIKTRLKKIIDPELGVNIVDLGLVRAISLTDRNINIKIILTSPGCPYGPTIVRDIKKAVGPQVKVEVIRDKLWTADMASEEVRTSLGLEP